MFSFSTDTCSKTARSCQLLELHSLNKDFKNSKNIEGKDISLKFSPHAFLVKAIFLLKNSD